MCVRRGVLATSPVAFTGIATVSEIVQQNKTHELVGGGMLTCPTSQSEFARHQIQVHPTGLRPALMNGHSKITSHSLLSQSTAFSVPVGLLGRLSRG